MDAGKGMAYDNALTSMRTELVAVKLSLLACTTTFNVALTVSHNDMLGRLTGASDSELRLEYTAVKPVSQGMCADAAATYWKCAHCIFTMLSLRAGVTCNNCMQSRGESQLLQHVA